MVRQIINNITICTVFTLFIGEYMYPFYEKSIGILLLTLKIKISFCSCNS